ncbi:hypothetical protein Hamer_G030908, partial [Homarus americanus]
ICVADCGPTTRCFLEVVKNEKHITTMLTLILLCRYIVMEASSRFHIIYQAFPNATFIMDSL